MMNVYGVNIMVPPNGDQNDLITITGPPANVEKAKEGLLEKVASFNKEKEDREARNQQVPKNARVFSRLLPSFIPTSLTFLY